jgi:anthranilate phosphoribosyltransferase
MLLVAERAPDLRDGIRLASDALESGAAREILERLVVESNA